MIHIDQHAFVALLLSLLLAGCSGNDRAEFRPASTARGIDRPASRRDAEPTTHPAELVAHVMAPDPRYGITMDEIRERVRNSEAVIIDARGPADFALGHIRGAINVPAGQIDVYMDQLNHSVAQDQLIIIYCNGPHCDSSDMVYEYLVPQGFTNMRVFKPGWAAIVSVSDLR